MPGAGELPVASHAGDEGPRGRLGQAEVAEQPHEDGPGQLGEVHSGRHTEQEGHQPQRPATVPGDVGVTVLLTFVRPFANYRL